MLYYIVYVPPESHSLYKQHTWEEKGKIVSLRLNKFFNPFALSVLLKNAAWSQLSHFLETPQPKVTKIAQKIDYKSTNRLALIWFRYYITALEGNIVWPRKLKH